MRTIPGRVGSGRLTCDYNAISVQLQLQLPTGTELGNRGEFAHTLQGSQGSDEAMVV